MTHLKYGGDFGGASGAARAGRGRGRGCGRSCNEPFLRTLHSPREFSTASIERVGAFEPISSEETEGAIALCARNSVLLDDVAISREHLHVSDPKRNVEPSGRIVE